MLDDDDDLSEKEKNLWYMLLEYCVPHFPSGVVMKYSLTGVKNVILSIAKLPDYAGLEQEPKELIFKPDNFNLPVELAKKILEMDKGLVMLRYNLSKRRVSETDFWRRYFTTLIITVRDYVCTRA